MSKKEHGNERQTVSDQRGGEVDKGGKEGKVLDKERE